MKIKKISSALLGVLIALIIMSFAVSAEGDVASIGDTTYATLAEAVTAANAMDGDVTITLLQDTTFSQAMTISKNITIEGGNHTLYRYDDETDNTLDYTGTLFTVEAGASLTLNDLTIDGNNNWVLNEEVLNDSVTNGTVHSNKSDFWTLETGAPTALTQMIYVTGGNLTLNNSTIQNNVAVPTSGIGKGAVIYGTENTTITLNNSAVKHCVSTTTNVSGIFVGAGSELIMNVGSEFSEIVGITNAVAVGVYDGGKFTMNGGEIKNNYGVGGNGTAMMVYNASTTGTPSEFIMNGGKITGNITTNLTSGGYAIYIHTNAKVTINDGEISDNVGLSSAVGMNKATSYLNVYGGYFSNTSLLGDDDIYEASGTALLYGGEYTSDVSAYCAPGYSLCGVDEDDDGEVDGYKVIKMIEVQFEAVSELDTEIERFYNINLITTDTNLVNKLEYVDLKFAFEQTEKWIGYEINATNENVDVNFVDNITPRYEFRFDELDTPAEETNKITIGQVKFTGYGAYTFAVDEAADTNTAYIKDDVVDDLVDIYIPEVVAGDGYLDIISNSIEEVVPMPKRKLTVNVNFANPIEYKAAAYQSMTAKIAGGTVSKEIALGNENIDETLDESIVNPATVSVSENGYAISLDLPYNTVYTVIIEGAGYRTGRYSVELSDNKTLNFWNNVKNTAEPIEEGSDVMVNHNFLAGDIIKDDNINLYDLSAILSYFGAKGISETNNPEYVKYDINRDGVIDSKDVAYILVAWGV